MIFWLFIDNQATLGQILVEVTAANICQPLSVIHTAKEMQLLTANDDLTQLTGGRPLDDISKMPSDDRRAVLCKYLVKEDPVVVQEPIAWSDEESIGRFLLLKR